MFSRKVLLRAFVCALLALVSFPDQENQLYDLKVKILSRFHFKKPENVTIVEVTKEGFDVLRRKYADESGSFPGEAPGPWREKFESLRNEFFWDDAVYENLLSRVLSENPRKFVVTFFYNESLVLLKNDSTLRRLARDPAVLWASQFDLDQRLLKPAPELTGVENYGFTNLHPDVDGVVRRAYLVHKNHISLPFRALLDDISQVKRNMPLSEPFLVKYEGRPGFFHTCQVTDLFETDPAKNHCGSLNNKFVLLSPSGNLMAGSSLYRTPVGYMSRGEVLANILLTALEESYPVPVPIGALFIFVVGHCLVIAWIVLSFGGRRQLTYVSLLLAGEMLFSLLLMAFLSLQVPLVPFIIATAAAHITFLSMKFGQQESKRWQAEKKAQYLRELDELKSNFISLMSHDLKTPIAKVQALTERLNREARSLTDDQREILAAIQRSNDELGQYILSILNFQKIESQELKLNRKSVDINLLIEEVSQRLTPLAQDNNVEIQLELEPMFAVEIDEQLIRQVLSNLMDNAIKYNKPGTKVTVRSADLGDFVEVTVEDNGIGIEAEQMERLFKKFSRSEKGTSERVKGTGLGLYLAKYFIEQHGGEIEVESELGKGTKFRFRLPVQGE